MTYTDFRIKIMTHSLNVYVNEERTRSFIGLKVDFGKNELKELVEVFNEYISQYSFRPFYEVRTNIIFNHINHANYFSGIFFSREPFVVSR